MSSSPKPTKNNRKLAMPITEQYTFTWHTFAEQMPKDDIIIYIRKETESADSIMRGYLHDNAVYVDNGYQDRVITLSQMGYYLWCYSTDVITGKK